MRRASPALLRETSALLYSTSMAVSLHTKILMQVGITGLVLGLDTTPSVFNFVRKNSRLDYTSAADSVSLAFRHSERWMDLGVVPNQCFVSSVPGSYQSCSSY